MSNAATARVDWFHRTERKYFTRDRDDADRTFSFDAPADADIEAILALGYSLGCPKGSARAGVYEVQTCGGIYTSPRGGRINPKTVIFRSWEQLEEQDA